MDNKTNTPVKTRKNIEVQQNQSSEAVVAVRNDLLASIMITSVLTNLAMFIAWLAREIA